MNQSQSLLLERVKSENARSGSCTEVSDLCADGACPIRATPEVREHRLSHSQREHAIELAELLEIHFQSEGRFIEAEYASHLRQQLIQGRTNVRSQP